MKPKQRLEQKQSSRLYLRKKDHREVIMNDIYHNAIWMKKEQDGEEKDELVWVKYPKDALLVATGNAYGWMGYYDIERQFQFGVPFGSSNDKTRLWEFDGFVVASNQNASGSGNTGKYYVTTDGVTWKEVKGTPLARTFTDFCQFGNRGACSYTSVSSGSYTVRISEVVYDEEADEWNFENHSYTMNAKGEQVSYICNTNEGAIFMECSNADAYQGYPKDAQFVRLDRDGNRHEGEHDFFKSSDAYPIPERSLRASTYCKKGNICCCASFGRVYTDSGWRYIFTTVATSDYGDSFSGSVIKSLGDNSQYDQLKIVLFCRGEYFYMMYSFIDKDVFYFKSTDGIVWNEVYVPSWIDLEYIKDGGIGVRKTPTDKETMRIAVKASEATDYDVTLYDMLDRATGYNRDIGLTLNRTSYSVRFKDGELVKSEDSEFYAVFGHPNNGWMAFFDNEYLASSAKACGWYGVGRTTVEGYGDTLQENDYCVRTVTPIESEVEE